MGVCGVGGGWVVIARCWFSVCRVGCAGFVGALLAHCTMGVVQVGLIFGAVCTLTTALFLWYYSARSRKQRDWYSVPTHEQ